VSDRRRCLNRKACGQRCREKRGSYYLTLKENQSDLLDWSQFISQYAPLEQTSFDEVKSGEVWTHTLEVWELPDNTSDFPDLKRFVRIRREVFNKRSRETKTGTAFALTNLTLPAAELLTLDRSRWTIENTSHHTRDTVFHEDTSRSRLGAQALSVFRNALNGFLQHLDVPDLRSVRSFSARPIKLFRLLKPK
jgi:hypothetical protein